jgi:hypothetical protein
MQTKRTLIPPPPQKYQRFQSHSLTPLTGRLLLETIVCLVVLGLFSIFIFEKRLRQLRNSKKSTPGKSSAPSTTPRASSASLTSPASKRALRKRGQNYRRSSRPRSSAGNGWTTRLPAARIALPSMLGAPGGFVPYY